MKLNFQTSLLGVIVCAIVGTPLFASPVTVDPFPVIAGQDVTIKYNNSGRILDGSPQVYAHIGFNQWSPTINPDPAMWWNSAENVWQYTVNVPAGSNQLDVVFQDGTNWDTNNSLDWHYAVLDGGSGGGGTWVMDGNVDADATLIAENNGQQLHAGLRGDVLYIAVPVANSGNDHFIFIADTPGSAAAAPWGKSGTVAGWDAYVGNEYDNNWCGWFDQTGTNATYAGSVLEATINLAEEFGSLPTEIYIAFAQYDTWTGGNLKYSYQVLATINSDGNVDSGEYAQITLSSIVVGATCSAVDLDGDCDADADDLAHFEYCETAGIPLPTNCLDADFDSDGDVDADDYDIFEAGYYTSLGDDYGFVAEDLGNGVSRFYPEGSSLATMPPSMSLESTPTVNGPSWAPFNVTPIFRDTGGRKSVVFELNGDESLYGTGEVYGDMVRNGKTIECWNSDRFAYGDSNPSLYQSHPWVLVVRPDGTSYGILADTTFRCRIDLTVGITFAAEGGDYPVYVFEANTPQEVITKLTNHIGRMEMPPLWSLGYQQSRYSYDSETYGYWVADNFRNRDIPCDVLWFDIDYMDNYKIFTWNSTNFPNLSNFNANLHNMNYKTVYMIDPGAKVESGYHVYDQGCAGDHWVHQNFNWYTGVVWPGDCHFPDYTRPETRTWWASLYPAFMQNGIDGIWNDMNEPGIFNGPGHSMPEDCWHRGGGGLPAGYHSQYHNVYGMLMTEASRDGMLQAKPNNRPFLLSRSNFIGGHRYAAMWTGDNRDTWEHLWYTNAMIANIGMSAQPFCGPDIGGFSGPCSDALFARWMGVGVFMPFARTHYCKGNPNREPWERGPYVEWVCKTSIERRYRMMPYFYTVFQEAAETGLPVLRPAFFADLTNANLRDEQTAFLIGSDILIVPDLYEYGTQPTPDHPAGIWRTISLVGEDSSTEQNFPDVKIRGGAIVPLGPVAEHTGEPLNPLTLTVCLDASGFAEGYLYEDDGDGFDYQTGDYRLTHYTATQVGNQVTIEIADVDGTRPAMTRNVTIDIITASGVVSSTVAEPASGVITVMTL